MLVNDWMNSDVITVHVDDSVQRAFNLMKTSQIALLPVLDEGRLVGIVADSDLKRAAPPQAGFMELEDVLSHLSLVRVGDVMSRDPITVTPDFTVEETADILKSNNIPGCPVINYEDELVGIITKNDLFKALTAVTGLTGKGFQFGFLVDDRPGAIQEVTDLIKHYNARLVSIMTTYDKAPKGFRFLFVRAFNVNRDMMRQLKKDLDATAKMLYMVDHRDGIRTIFADPNAGL